MVSPLRSLHAFQEECENEDIILFSASDLFKFLETNLTDFKEMLTQVVPVCRESIDDEYIIAYFNTIAEYIGKDNPKYDAIFALSAECRHMHKTNRTDKDALLLKCIRGLLVYHTGKCLSYPANPGFIYVSIICSNAPAPPVLKGKYLMSSFLYCMKDLPVQNQTIILELLDGYSNISGFLSYSDVGFVRDYKLFNNCLKTYEMLPMKFQLQSASKEDIIKRCKGDVTHVKDPIYKWMKKHSENLKQKMNQEKIASRFLSESKQQSILEKYVKLQADHFKLATTHFNKWTKIEFMYHESRDYDAFMNAYLDHIKEREAMPPALELNFDEISHRICDVALIHEKIEHDINVKLYGQEFGDPVRYEFLRAVVGHSQIKIIVQQIYPFKVKEQSLTLDELIHLAPEFEPFLNLKNAFYKKLYLSCLSSLQSQVLHLLQ